MLASVLLRMWTHMLAHTGIVSLDIHNRKEKFGNPPKCWR